MDPSTRPVTVVGAGYVGLVTAVGLARLGRHVHLVETGAARLRDLLDGRVPIHEAGLQDAFDEAVAAGRLSVGDAPHDDPGISLVCVGTPIDEAGAERPAGTRRDPRRPRRPGGRRRHRRHPEHRPRRRHAPIGRGRRPADRTRLHEPRVPPPGDRRRGLLADRAGSSSGASRTPIRSPSKPSWRCTTSSTPRGWSSMSRQSEIIKNGANAFLALKLSFTNEIASLCEEAGADAGDGPGRDRGGSEDRRRA